MSYLQFGADIRFENIISLGGMSRDDAEVFYDNFDEFIGVITAAGIDVSGLASMEHVDETEIQEWFSDSATEGLIALACTPVPQMSNCGRFISDMSWGWYVRLPVYAKSLDELKAKAVEAVSDYRQMKMVQAAESESEK